MPIVESEFALLRDPRLAAELAEQATASNPVWLWSTDGTRLLWANGVGAAIFGAKTRRFAATDPVAPQIVRLAATLPSGGAPRLERLRGFGGSLGRLVICVCARVTLAEGRAAILVSATEPAGRSLTLEERVHWLFADDKRPLAVFARDGALLFATKAACSRVAEASSLAALGIEPAAKEALARGRARTADGNGVLDLERLGRDANAVLVVTFPPAPRESEATPSPAPSAASAAALHPRRAALDAAPAAEAPPLQPPTDAPLAADEPTAFAEPAAAASSSSHAPTIEPATPPPRPHALAEPTPERRHPLRFVWQMDADGRFAIGSDEFTELMGPRTMAAFGRLWSEIATVLDLDPDDQVARAVATRDTWSGITVAWPVDELGERLPVELSGLPVYDRARNFRGYRGFGVCRDLTRINQLARLRRERPIGFVAPPEAAGQRGAPAAAESAATESVAAAVPEPAPAAASAAAPEAPPAAEAEVSVAAESEAATAPEAPTEALSVPAAPSAAPETAPPEAAAAELPTASPESAAEEPPRSPAANSAESLAPPAAAILEPAPPPLEPAPPVEAAPPLEVPPPSTAAVPPPEAVPPLVVVPAAPPIVAVPSATAANVVPFRPGSATEAKPPILSPVERRAFRELADELAARLHGTREALQREGDAAAPQSSAAAAAESPPASVKNDAGGAALDLALLDELPLGVLISRDDTLLYGNRHLLQWSGYESLEALSAAGGLRTLIGPDMLAVLATSGERQSLSVTHRDGEQLAAEARAVTISWNGAPAQALVLASRESEERQRQASVVALGAAASEIRELKAMLEATGGAVLVLDRDGTIVTATRSAEELFGVGAGALHRRRLADLLAAESVAAARDYLDRVSHGGAEVAPEALEVNARLVSGELAPFALRLTRINGGHVCAVLRELASIKKLEDELRTVKREAQKAGATKAEFIAKLSHEIRTPLNAITGFAEVIIGERFGPLHNERYREYLKDIHAAAAHLVSLLNDLLDLSKVETGQLNLTFSNVSLNELTQQCVGIMQPQASRARIIIRTSLMPGLPQVVADERSLRQIVLNLLSRSIRFTGPGGQVIVSTAFADTGEAVLRVRDTGIGMNERDVDTALEPFRQSETSGSWGASGTGLGLPLTKALAEANRAHFSIRSAPNVGTLVEVAFPPTRVVAR